MNFKILIKLFASTHRKNTKQAMARSSLSEGFQPKKSKQLNPFLNRIALIRIQQPYIYID
jgi:hypothetical protein